MGEVVGRVGWIVEFNVVRVGFPEFEGGLVIGQDFIDLDFCIIGINLPGCGGKMDVILPGAAVAGVDPDGLKCVGAGAEVFEYDGGTDLNGSAGECAIIQFVAVMSYVFASDVKGHRGLIGW